MDMHIRFYLMGVNSLMCMLLHSRQNDLKITNSL